MARKSDTIILNFRLPKALHRRLARIAAENNQSLNSEMIDRLKRSFDYEAIKGLEDDVMAAMRFGIIEMLRAVARGDETAANALKDARVEAALRKALADKDRQTGSEDEGEQK
jgi:hypothetical protein